MGHTQRQVYWLQAAQITACMASCKGTGNRRPRRSARRRIPAHAVALKKYFGGIKPCSSTGDKEQTTALLGQAEILGIEDAPRN
jgi:hypothetical protein